MTLYLIPTTFFNYAIVLAMPIMVTRKYNGYNCQATIHSYMSSRLTPTSYAYLGQRSASG